MFQLINSLLVTLMMLSLCLLLGEKCNFIQHESIPLRELHPKIRFERAKARFTNLQFFTYDFGLSSFSCFSTQPAILKNV